MPPDTDIEVTQSPYQALLDAVVAAAAEPVLQIGSLASTLDQSPKNWRSRFAGKTFVGMDATAGANVDIVADIAAPPDELRAKLDGRSFGAIICAHVLEHVRQPWLACKNIESLLRPNGVLFVQSPWVQGFHGYPNDYWRFSLAGLQAMFPAIELIDWSYSGGSSDYVYRVVADSKPVTGGLLADIERDLLQIVLSPTANAAFLRGAGRPKINLSRGYMPVCVINLLGRKVRA